MMKQKCLRKNRAGRHRSNAQSMVEFALILPVILITLFTLIEVARLLHAWIAIENGARFGVRYAVTGEYDPSYCPMGDCSTDGNQMIARVKSIDIAAEAGSASILRDFTLDDVTQSGFFRTTVCDDEDKIIRPDPPVVPIECKFGEHPGYPGKTVIVVVEFTHPLITPILTGIVPNLHLTAEREAIVETFRITSSSGSPPTIVAPTPIDTNAPPPTATNTEVVGPECENITYKGWTWKPGRLYITFQDNNPEDGYITSFSFDFPSHVDGKNYYVNRFEFHPYADDVGEQAYQININKPDPFTLSFSVGNNLWVSPSGGRSRIDVEFGGDLPGGDLPGGKYYIWYTVYYPFYDKTCPLGPFSRDKSGILPTSTSRSGTSGPPEPTSTLPGTQPPPKDTPRPEPTDPPPTPRD